MSEAIRMTRLATGRYELYVDGTHLELICKTSSVTGSQGRPIAHKEWVGYVNGQDVGHADNARDIREKLARYAHPIQVRQQRKQIKEQAQSLLERLFPEGIPIDVQERLDNFDGKPTEIQPVTESEPEVTSEEEITEKVEDQEPEGEPVEAEAPEDEPEPVEDEPVAEVTEEVEAETEPEADVVVEEKPKRRRSRKADELAEVG